MNIHFICRGNVFRSVIAEAYLKSLDLESVHVVSSGTNVDWSNPTERAYFDRTLSFLEAHGLKSYAKTEPDQLTQERIDANHDSVILMNQRVDDEAKNIVTLPPNAIVWQITDIGEGGRIDDGNLGLYEEQIYQEIIRKVDDLVSLH